MDIFSIFTMLGGLAFFMFGMNVMSASLEKMSGGKLEQTLRSLTDNKFKGFLLGAGLTVAMQSSSAMTVMLVGLVNSGIMQLKQTIAVIMGSNVGTTLTAWILGLAGIQSDSFVLSLLKPENFAPIFAFIGIILRTVSKDQKKHDISDILLGFAVLMFGMEIMGDAVKPLADMPQFASLLTAFDNPILAVLISAVFTGVIQSSAATIGILQALCLTGGITYNMAIPIIMGLNIGTCMTALLSSIGANKSAKRVVVIHFSFNIIGTVLCMILYFGLSAIFPLPFGDSAISTFGIALVHSVFNIFTTIALFPFMDKLEKIAFTFVKGDIVHDEHSFIDERLFNTPSIALAECESKLREMAQMSRNLLFRAMSLVGEYSDEKANELLTVEDELDMYEDKLSSSLMIIASKDINEIEAKKVSQLTHVANDFERIGDHATNIIEIARSVFEKELAFSSNGAKELGIISSAIKEVVDNTITVVIDEDLKTAFKIEPLEEVIDCIVDQMKSNHIQRLQNKECNIESGFAFADLLSNYERISDHCSNIALSLIELAQKDVEAHDYILGLRESPDADFTRRMNEYKEKYSL